MLTNFTRSILYFFSSLVFLGAAEGSVGSNKAPRYVVSVCAIFQNEAFYLREWIEYHRLIGVEHFYLFNNDSTDNYLEILTPYISEKIVEVIDWPSRDKKRSWMKDQIEAYNHCIKKTQNVSSWLALIDLDEFIVPVEKSTLVEYLKDFEQRPQIGCIKMHFQLYGTSFLPTLPTDRLMIESFILKAPTDYASTNFPNNTVIKSIVRPEAVKQYEIHTGTLKKGFTAYPEGGHDRFLTPVQIDQIRLNHYWTRAEDFFYNIKIGRRTRFTGVERERIIQKLADLNAVEDKAIFKYVPALRERMGFPVN